MFRTKSPLEHALFNEIVKIFYKKWNYCCVTIKMFKITIKSFNGA